MKPHEHYTRAEDYLSSADWEADLERKRLLIAEAQVHATLALVPPAITAETQTSYPAGGRGGNGEMTR